MRLDRPEGNLDPTRRALATSLFFAGYASAAVSSCAAPVTTPADDLITEDVHIAGHNAYRLPAYTARPRTPGRKGAVIVVNEVFGIHDYIKDVCRRFAREGYVAIAPDYFDRAGDPAPLTDFGAIRQIVAATPYTQVMADTSGAINWLKAQSFVHADRLGITGFCWGGGVVWMAAAHMSNLKAGVAWYGRLAAPGPSDFGYEAGRQWPLDVAAGIAIPVLGLYGENDSGIPLPTVESMRAALAAAGNPTGSEIVVYPGAAHGFHADYRESYNPEAAADGWARSLVWFRRHGVV